SKLLGQEPRVVALCLGANSEAFAAALVAIHPELRDRVTASGFCDATEVSLWLQACDLLLQPYPDGVTTRRTSVMAALATGVPVLTTSGALTEPVWKETEAVALASADDIAAIVEIVARLADDAPARGALGARGRCAYDERFALGLTIERLRAA